MKRLEQRVKAEDFGEIRIFIEKVCKECGVSDRNSRETMLVFEAIYGDLFRQGMGGNTELEIEGRKTFGDTKIILGFEGKMFTPVGESDGMDADNIVLKSYADKIDYIYHGGYNNISIMVRRNHSKSLTYCVLGILAAFLMYIIMSLTMSDASRLSVLTSVIHPFEKLFINAVLMVGAPVTFFSLLKNMTDVYIVAERDSSMRKLQLTTLITSATSIILALCVGFLLMGVLSSRRGFLSEYTSLYVNLSIPEMIETLVPKSIFEPFETISPFPLLIIAALCTYAFCSVGKYFDIMKTATEAFYTFFSKMLGVIIFTLPFFSFVAFMDILLGSGYTAVISIIALLVVVMASLVVLFAYYAIRLKLKGIKIGPQLKKMPDFLRENLWINSAIDAAPFNIRYCSTRFGMSRKKMEEELPLLAQVNLDGNCYILTLLSILFIFAGGASVSVLDLIVIALLVLFLSLGAPNQPGSSLIGMLIIINYLQAYEMLAVAIYAEVFLGSILNLTNVIGDIVTVAPNKRLEAVREE